jgi:hypothetical protein
MLSLHGEPVVSLEHSDVVSPTFGLAGVSVENDRITTIDLCSVPPGTTLILETRNSTYRIVVLDGEQGHALVQGGAFFGDQTDAWVGGAAGCGALKIGRICVDLCLEVWVGSRRIVTSPVRSIRVEAYGPTESRLEPEHEDHESRRVQRERPH